MVNSINKGKEFEREIAKLLTQRTGVKWQRVPHSGALATSQQLQDKNFRGDVFTEDTTYGDWMIECKITGDTLTLEALLSRTSMLWKWWNQAFKQRADGQEAILIFRFRGSPLFVLCEHPDIPGELEAKTVMSLNCDSYYLGRLTE